MKLLLIYGPPAAGKLTVANAVAERTNFRVFHNHLTIELVKEVFGEQGRGSGLGKTLRLAVIEAAAKADINLIFTIVFAKGEDEEYIREIVTLVEAHGGEVCFVQLVPDPAEVHKRVVQPSRQAFSKIKDPALLQEVMAAHDLYGAVPYNRNLTIDNTHLAPAAVAEQIIKHFSL